MDKEDIAFVILLSGLIGYLFKDKIVALFGGKYIKALSTLGSLSSVQLKSIAEILKAWRKHGDGDQNKLVYIFATAWHESKIQPIEEYRGATLTAAQSNYWHTGFYGRGFVQLTWENNYRKMSDVVGIDLVASPEKALNPKIAAEVLVYGMIKGSFTGKPLSQYINSNEVDFYNARRVVNGLDKAYLIASYADKIKSNL